MALEKVTYVNDQTVITAEQMNAIQDAIIANEKKIVVSNVAPEDTSALWIDTSDNSDDGLQEAVDTALEVIENGTY